MTRLSLLGVVDLRGSDGRERAAVLKQPKRLALLAYLVGADPRRFHRRDALLGMFWPELDTAHARSSLRRALYFLRRQLGKDSIVARGDEVGTVAEQLWCDVPAFREAVEDDRVEDALALYRGDLLEGFFVASAPDFGRWLESERSQLRAEAAGAAWALAARAASGGNAGEVARRAQQALRLSPDDEALLRRSIALLDGVGARSAALQSYDSFARRLAEEFGAAPAPETRALIEAVKDRRTPAAAPAGTVQELTATVAPSLIAVLPFTVRGEETLRYLREGMVDLLSAKLDRAGDVRTVDPRALLRYVQSLGIDEVDPGLGHSVAAHFGAGIYVLGSVVGAGGRFHVAARIYETNGAGEAQADVEAGGESEIFSTVDALVRRLLARRTTSLGGRMARLAAVTTDSLAALKAYLVGERAFRGGEYVEALTAYRAAVAEDPGFALGHYRLAATYAACGMPDAAREPSDRAWDHRGRLHAYTQLLLRAQAARLRSDPATAETLYTRVVATSPDDVEAWYLLGDLQFCFNPYRGRSAVEARVPLERALELDPKHLGALSDLVRLAALERRHDVLDALLGRFLERYGRTERALALRAIRAFGRHDETAQREIAAGLNDADAVTATDTISETLLYAVDLPAAARLARHQIAQLPAPELQAVLHLGLAHVAHAQGDRDTAGRELDAVAAVDGDTALAHRAWLATLPFVAVGAGELAVLAARLEAWRPEAGAERRERPAALAAPRGCQPQIRSYLAGLIAARRGDLRAAREYAEQCESHERPPDTASLTQNLAAGVRARIALLEGDRGGALGILDGLASEYWLALAAVSPFHALAGERYLRAETLIALGREREAVGWLEGLGQRSVYELVFRATASRYLAAIRRDTR